MHLLIKSTATHFPTDELESQPLTQTNKRKLHMYLGETSPKQSKDRKVYEMVLNKTLHFWTSLNMNI